MLDRWQQRDQKVKIILGAWLSARSARLSQTLSHKVWWKHRDDSAGYELPAIINKQALPCKYKELSLILRVLFPLIYSFVSEIGS